MRAAESPEEGLARRQANSQDKPRPIVTRLANLQRQQSKSQQDM
jgi:hypothetical protein